MNLRQSMAAERLKLAIRLLESRYTPFTRTLAIDDRRLKVARSFWWDDTLPALFAKEIEPYWQALSRRTFQTVLDIGAATGQFTLSVCVRIPTATVVAFEPSRRQAELLRRNVGMNGFSSRVRIEHLALWNRTDDMIFRSNGSISALRDAGDHLTGLPFAERVRAEPLDAWKRRTATDRVDLVKMDIEGAEIEALEGAVDLLRDDRPELLVQAYHIRNGERTFAACQSRLSRLGYTCSEIGLGSGLLHAVPATTGAASRRIPGV